MKIATDDWTLFSEITVQMSREELAIVHHGLSVLRERHDGVYAAKISAIIDRLEDVLTEEEKAIAGRMKDEN